MLAAKCSHAAFSVPRLCFGSLQVNSCFFLCVRRCTPPPPKQTLIVGKQAPCQQLGVKKCLLASIEVQNIWWTMVSNLTRKSRTSIFHSQVQVFELHDGLVIRMKGKQGGLVYNMASSQGPLRFRVRISALAFLCGVYLTSPYLCVFLGTSFPFPKTFEVSLQWMLHTQYIISMHPFSLRKHCFEVRTRHFGDLVVRSPSFENHLFVSPHSVNVHARLIEDANLPRGVNVCVWKMVYICPNQSRLDPTSWDSFKLNRGPNDWAYSDIEIGWKDI